MFMRAPTLAGSVLPVSLYLPDFRSFGLLTFRLLFGPAHGIILVFDGQGIDG